QGSHAKGVRRCIRCRIDLGRIATHGSIGLPRRIDATDARAVDAVYAGEAWWAQAVGIALELCSCEIHIDLAAQHACRKRSEARRTQHQRVSYHLREKFVI